TDTLLGRSDGCNAQVVPRSQPGRRSNLESTADACFATGARTYRVRPRRTWIRLESSMENLTWVIGAIGALVGGPIMMLGVRNSGDKPVPFDQVAGALKQDWTRTDNIDFHASSLEDP